MASHTMSPSIWSSFGNLFGGLTGNLASHSSLEPSHEERRTERDFLIELIWDNPDAFSSELDVQSLMQFYSGRF